MVTFLYKSYEIIDFIAGPAGPERSSVPKLRVV